jgi:hypothetical protein
MLARAAQALRAAGTAVAQAFGSLSDGIGLEAGRMGRRLGSWIPSRVHVNTLINQSGPNTLARARYLARNNGYAFSAVECFSSNLVGAGIKPSWKSPLPVPDVEDDGADAAAKAASDQKKTVHELWDRWVTEADAEGITNFYGLQKRVARELFIAGEVFVRLRRATSPTASPFLCRSSCCRRNSCRSGSPCRFPTATGFGRASSSTGSAGASPITSGASIRAISRRRRSSASGCACRRTKSCTSSIRSRPDRSAACRD